MTEQLAGQISLFDPDSPCGKMFLERIPAMAGGISKRSSKPSAILDGPEIMYLSLKNGGVQGASWAKVTALPGEHMMLNTGPGPHNGESASTLSQILQANAPEKYFLSKKACQGIINRAKKRGKDLPKILLEALLEVIETA